MIEDSNLTHSVYAIGFLLPGLACLEADFCTDLPEEMTEDEVWTLIDLIEADPDLSPAGSRTYPTYRAYPQNWNGQTLSDPVNRQ